MSNRNIIYILDKGLFLSPFTEEELFTDGKLNLQKFAQAECIASPSFATSLVACAIDGSIESVQWQEQYNNYIKPELFNTYKELLVYVSLTQHASISSKIKKHLSLVQNEFARFYALQYECEEKILDLSLELFFQPQFYPANALDTNEIDIYCQFDKYGLKGFVQTLFYYSINQNAFQILNLSSKDFCSNRSLNKKIETLRHLVDPNIMEIYLTTLLYATEVYKAYCLEQYKIKYQNDIHYMDEKNIWKQVIMDEFSAFASLRAHKTDIPERLFHQLEMIEDVFITQLVNSSGIEIQAIEDQANIVVAIKRVAQSTYSKNHRPWSKADWGVIFRLLSEQGHINSCSYEAGADMINKACGEIVTNASSIKNSHAITDIGGTYQQGWTDKAKTRQSSGLLAKYNEMAKIFLGA